MNATSSPEYSKFFLECKKCLVSPLFFKKKESVVAAAKETYQFFKDNPKTDYVAFFDFIRELSAIHGTDKTKQCFCAMEEILEYSGLIPSVRAKLCQKIVAQSFGGVGDRVVSKILNIPERVVINVRRWYAKDNLKPLYDEFAEKFLSNPPKSLDELLDALIRYRKDFNAEYVAKVAERLSEAGTVRDGRKKLSKRTRERIRYLENSAFNWDNEIDFQEVFESKAPVEEDEMDVDAYEDEEEVYSKYDRELEAQVVTPPAWYIEEVWGKYKLPGIHLPQEMMARYLSLYEKKRNGKARPLYRASYFNPSSFGPTVEDSSSR